MRTPEEIDECRELGVELGRFDAPVRMGGDPVPPPPPPPPPPPSPPDVGGG